MFTSETQAKRFFFFFLSDISLPMIIFVGGGGKGTPVRRISPCSLPNQINHCPYFTINYEVMLLINVGPSILQDSVIFKIVENSLNVPIDLSQGPVPFPMPTSFNWTKDGVPLNGPAVTYSNITFPAVNRNDSGRYQN